MGRGGDAGAGKVKGLEPAFFGEDGGVGINDADDLERPLGFHGGEEAPARGMARAG